jgi:hypothetical protein
MAEPRVLGYGGNIAKTTFVNDQDPGLRVQGWGGGRQWKMHAVIANPRIRGNANTAQWTLHIPAIPPP